MATGSYENKSQKQVWFTDTFHELITPRAGVILKLHAKPTLTVLGSKAKSNNTTILTIFGT